MGKTKKICIISDGTGQTARRLMDSVLANYSRDEIDFAEPEIFQEVRDKAAVHAVLRDVDTDCLVLYSIISSGLARYFNKELEARGVVSLNVLKPMVNTLSKFFGVKPTYEPGSLQVVDDNYYKKVDAIGYTVEHDDGRGEYNKEADVVLLGLSRTCKTPISMYLACNYGLKVVNIPVVADPTLARNLLLQLKGVERGLIFGLLMQPDVLAHVREERSSYLIHDSQPGNEIRRYFDVREIRSEFRFCREFFESNDICMINVTRRAIEEISMEILDSLGHDE